MAEINSYKYWMDQLATRSKSTTDNYRLFFRQFLEFTGLTANELIELQRKAMAADGDPRENHVVETKVRAWLASMKDTKSPSTRRSCLSTVRSFFQLNYHPLRLTRLDSVQGESRGSRTPERIEVVEILKRAKWKYRAVILFLKDSGLRVSDMVQVTWEQKEDLGNGFWNFRIETQKKKVQACAFIGPDTTPLLEEFTNKRGKIFGSARRSAVVTINAIIKRAGIEGVTAHGLRKYFVASMEHVRVPKDQYLYMMGKKSSVYSEKRRSELLRVGVNPSKKGPYMSCVHAHRLLQKTSFYKVQCNENKDDASN